MPGEIFKRRFRVLLAFAAGLVMILALAGCGKKSGIARVLEKEHIPAREITPTPAPGPSETPGASTPSPRELTNNETREDRALAEDEVVVDTIIMKKDVRGTSRDPRATDDEKWLVKVRMIAGGLQFNVYTDKLRWEKLKIGDQVKVSYRQGKYTGTVWSSELE